MEITRKTLFENEALQIGLFEARPVSDASAEFERQNSNILVLPFSGVFSRHDAPNRYVVGTPSHAVLFAPNTPYRLGFPGAVGDRALTFRFGEDLAPERLDASGSTDDMGSHGLLSANAIMLRNLLGRRLEKGAADAFEIEIMALDIVHLSLESMRRKAQAVGQPALARRIRALERVKEAVAVAPADKWNIAKLAKVANLSPFHLCHVFREVVGTSVYNYVLHERLARALDNLLDHGDDITSIAMEAGFASHSHFTEHFRRFFGCTPAALRLNATAGRARELCKIATARRN
jgi:AraC family transcriptional regulator